MRCYSLKMARTLLVGFSLAALSCSCSADTWAKKLYENSNRFVQEEHKTPGLREDKPLILKDSDSGPKIVLDAIGMAFQIPVNYDEITIIEGFKGQDRSVSLNNRFHKKRGLMLALDHDGYFFETTFLEMSFDRLFSILGEHAIDELYKYMLEMKALSEEERFRLALKQTPELLKEAGSDHRKAVFAYVGLCFRHSWARSLQYRLMRVGRNKVYFAEELGLEESHHTAWIFNDKGIILGQIMFYDEAREKALELAGSIEKLDSASSSGKQTVGKPSGKNVVTQPIPSRRFTWPPSSITSTKPAAKTPSP